MQIKSLTSTDNGKQIRVFHGGVCSYAVSLGWGEHRKELSGPLVMIWVGGIQAAAETIRYGLVSTRVASAKVPALLCLTIHSSLIMPEGTLLQCFGICDQIDIS